MKIIKDDVTTVQKRKVAEDITASLVTTLGKRPKNIQIVIDEVAPVSWGYARMLTREYLAQATRERASV